VTVFFCFFVFLPFKKNILSVENFRFTLACLMCGDNTASVQSHKFYSEKTQSSDRPG